MPIGTSAGAYYANMMDMLSQQPPQTEDHNVVNPFTTPGLQTMDRNEYSADEKAQEIQNQDNVVHDIKYDTELTPDQEVQYQKLYGKDADKDYDMRGYFKAHPDVKPNAPGVHYPDTYKKPNHPTFSDESIYNGKDGNLGGHWSEENGQWSFTPGPTNIKNFGIDGLKKYFKEVEPDSKLVLPQSKTERYINKALEPFTSYPEVYSSMNKAARNKMSRGVEELRHGGLNGIFDTITGGLSYINSPIEAAVDTTLGKPLQDLTGIPKEMTDFATESFLPGYGIEEIKDMALMRKVKEIEPALEHFGKEVTKKLPDLTANTEDENE